MNRFIGFLIIGLLRYFFHPRIGPPAQMQSNAAGLRSRRIQLRMNSRPQSSDPLGRMAAGNTMSHDLAIRGGLGLGGGGRRSAQ
jgi:hypothetical protein